MTSAETIIRELLSTFTDARDPLSKSGVHGDGNGTPSMTSQWKQGSYQPLEDALKEMRSRGKQEAIDGIPLQTYWWHLAMRYLMSERKAIWMVGDRKVENMIRRDKCICGFRFYSTDKARTHIEQVHKPTALLTVVYTSDYQRVSLDRKEKCEELGVQWLCAWFKRKKIQPRLPKDFREKAA